MSGVTFRKSIKRTFASISSNKKSTSRRRSHSPTGYIELDKYFMVIAAFALILIAMLIEPVISVSPLDLMHADTSGSVNSFLPHQELLHREVHQEEENAIHANNHTDGANIPHSRSKRGVVQLAGMISCVAGCDPLIYKGYGCYCGYSGRGIPVDGIDRCCMKHDSCYTRTGCSSFKQYVLSYSWDCITHGYASCAAAYSEGACAARLCQCDLKFARCLNAYHCPMGRPSCPSSKLRSLFSMMMPFG